MTFMGLPIGLAALTWMAAADVSDALPDLVGGFASAYHLGPAAAALLLEQSGAASQVRYA